jgi:hypothetical protein
MRASEILRKLADVVAAAETDETGMGQMSDPRNKATLSPVAVDYADQTEPTTMVAPLQQKLELLKKSAGVPSTYGNTDADNDELAAMKKSAGITYTVGEDNDIGD